MSPTGTLLAVITVAATADRAVAAARRAPHRTCATAPHPRNAS